MTSGSENIFMHLTPFNSNQPSVWFHQTQAAFSARRITSQNLMYSYTVGSLPAEIAEEIDGLLKNPPANKPFECLKESIFRRVGNAKVKDLYTNMSLGDKTISQLLRYMKIEKSPC